MSNRVPTRFLLAACTGLVLQAALASADWPTKGWPRTTPEAAGLDPKALSQFDDDISSGLYGHVDAMIVIRHGAIAYERTWEHDYASIYAAQARNPGTLNAHEPSGPYNYLSTWWYPFYRRGNLHTMQSVTKSVTSIAIGIATGRGEFPSLDTPLLSFFDAAKVRNVDDRKRRITLRHVLTMTTGLDWNEDISFLDPQNTAAVMEATPDWVQFTIDRAMAHEPGETFRYNSGAAQLLAYVFRVATGRDLEEYCAEHLFAPLGIGEWAWKRIPTGLVDTEGGLYLSARDLAKLAYLYEKEGLWDARRVVPADWVRASVTPAATVSAAGVKYGFLWWLLPYGKDGCFATVALGFGGQQAIVMPELDMVVVFTGWNILPKTPSLRTSAAVERVLAAVVDGPRR